MRRKERINEFFDKVNSIDSWNDFLMWLDPLSLRDNLKKESYITMSEDFYNKSNFIKSFWEENPDLRMSQVLVCLIYLDNYPGFWFYKEEEDYLNCK